MQREELARRLCEREHLFNPTGVPCGSHLQRADYLLVLTTPAGDVALGVIARARYEAGLPVLPLGALELGEA